MPLFRCRFCSHDNPAGAKFCNECGSPLHLRPCPECEAINDRAALACYSCGKTFAEPSPDAPAPVTAESAVPDDSTSPKEPAPALPENFGDRFDAILGKMDGGERLAEVRPAAVIMEERDIRHENAVSLFRGAHKPHGLLAMRANGSSVLRHRLSQALASVLVVTGATASAYYFYHHPVHWDSWLKTHQTAERLLPAEGTDASTRAIGSARDEATPVTASAPSLPAATTEAPSTGVAVAETAAAPGDTMSNATASATANTNGAGNDTNPAVPDVDTTHAEASVDVAEPTAPSGEIKASEPTMAPSSSSDFRKEAVRPRRSLTASNATRHIRRSPAPSMLPAPTVLPLTPMSERGGALPLAGKCTEAVAALGLCAPKRRDEARR